MKQSIINLLVGLLVISLILAIICGIETDLYPKQIHMKYSGQHGFKIVENIQAGERHDWNNSDIITITKRNICIGDKRCYNTVRNSGFIIGNEIYYHVTNKRGKKIQVTLIPNSDTTLQKIIFTPLEDSATMFQIFTN